MKKAIKISLCDPGHTTLLLANNFVPLNLGFIAAYLDEKFGNAIDITLFKDPQQCLKFVQDERPDILACSNYAWNSRLSRNLLNTYKKVHPKGISILGGPNFPKDHARMKTWLQENPIIDFAVENEGETSMFHIVNRLFEVGCSSDLMKEQPIPGVFFLDAEDGFIHRPFEILKELDDIPSPYLSGILDPFLLGDVGNTPLLPMIEGTRGCPFACTFCRAGIETNKMRMFGTDRVSQEIEYIADLITRNGRPIKDILITDQNFGIIKRDIQIAETLQKSLDKTGFPVNALTTSGKTNVDVVLETMSRYDGLTMTLSVQSMDDEVLKNIKRVNFPVDKFKAYQQKLDGQNKLSRSDVIVALPGETYDSHLDTLRKLFEIGIGEVDPFTHMMLLGTESEMSETREKYGYKTKWRLLPGGFTEYYGKIVFESEEVIISTNTMRFEEYIQLRTIHLLYQSIYNGSIFIELKKLIGESGIDPIALLLNIEHVLTSDDGPEKYADLSSTINAFIKKTEGELFSNRNELEAFYRQDENYSQLLAGEIGENLLQVHRFRFYMNLGNFANLVTDAFKNMAADMSVDGIAVEAVCDFIVRRSECMADLFNGEPKNIDRPLKIDMAFDLGRWMAAYDGGIQKFRNSRPINHKMFHRDNKIQEFKGYLGSSHAGLNSKARVLYRTGIENFFPTVETIEQNITLEIDSQAREPLVSPYPPK